MTPSVFVIILNWNGWHDTIECVCSCRKLNYPNIEILVVDNGSEDKSVAELKRAFPDLNLLETGKNLGFAGGNNIGIKYALENGAEYVWLLNNDTRVDPEALTELISVADSGEKIGMVGSKILTYSDPSVLHFGGGQVNLQTGDTFHMGAWKKDTGQFDAVTDVDYVTGCSMLVKRQVVEKIGLMPQEYFLYFEETDWCMKARKAGYVIRMSPHSRVFHKVSASIKHESPRKIYYLTRNRLFFLRKHGKNIKWLHRVLTDLRKSLSYIKRGHLRNGLAILKGYSDWASNKTGPIKN